MQNHKGFRRIICVTILCALLMVSMGRATRVSAVGTTIAASAAAALCAVGIVYCSYMALTGASVHVPDSVENIQSWLVDMGAKVVQFPSGRAAYEELYPELIGIGDEPLTSMLDRAWTWTTDKLKSWANDFSSTDVMIDIASFDQYIDVSQVPTNTFDYGYTFTAVPDLIYDSGRTWTFEQYMSRNNATITQLNGVPIVYTFYGQHTIINTNISTPCRNYLGSDGKYIPQTYVNGQWTVPSTLYNFTADVYQNGRHWSLIPQINPLAYYVGSGFLDISTPQTYPIFPQSEIYDSVNDETIPLVVVDSHELVRNPQWPTLPPEHDNKPVIPYLKLPFDPSWIDPITGTSGGGNWGFNLSQLLDTLEDLAGLMMEIGSIAELINQFKDLITGQSGDEYYIYYDDSEHDETFYQYYTITNYNGDVYQYDIDVSDVEEHLPVDLNTISLYTHNNYLDEVKSAARGFGNAIGEYVAFWHNCDPVITYTILGSFILILLGAFIGKWGHS